MGVSAIILCAKKEEFIDVAIKSIVDNVDEIVIVGDPDYSTRELIVPFLDEHKVKLLWREWDENYAKARIFAINNCRNDWILMVDADEILENSDKLKSEIESMNKIGCKVMNITYEHFMWHLGLVDDAKVVHYGYNRLFHKDGVTYKSEIHEVAMSDNWINDKKEILRLTSKTLKLWHLGYMKSRKTIVDKYNLNHKKKGHSKEFLDEWIVAHLTGRYSAKVIDIKAIPKIIQEYFHITPEKVEEVNKMQLKKESEKNEN